MAGVRKLERKELQFGYSINPNGVLACPSARAVFSVDKICVDSARCYSSSGIASEEMLLQKAVELKAGVGLQGVGRSVAEVKWQRSDAQFSSPS